MKKYFLIAIVVGSILLTGCNAKNNDVTDNNGNSDVNPTQSPETSFQTMTCTKNNENMGVEDGTKYYIKHDGQNVKSITMKLDYNITNDSDKEMFDKNKSLFEDIADKFKDVVGVTTNIVEDSVDMFQADLTLAVDKMSDTDINQFDQFKISKQLEEQKKVFEDKGYTCK